MRLFPVRSFALLLVWPLVASTQTEREHGVHVHGRSQVDLVYVSGQLELQLHAPGLDIVGFEHAPRDERESHAIAQALSALETHDQWLGFEPTDACTVTHAETHTHGYKKASDTRDNVAVSASDHARIDHPNDSDHAHEEHEGDHDHAEFHVSVKAKCSATPEALLIRLSERFSKLELIRVDYVTETTQNRVELGRGEMRVPLK